MSITPDNELSGAEVSVFEPCLIDGLTTRWPFMATGDRIDQAIIALSNDGGKARFSVFDSTIYDAGDIVEITGGTVDFLQYNGIHVVHSRDSIGNVTLVTAYSAAATGTKGLLKRLNHGLHIQVSTDGNMIRVPVTSAGIPGTPGTDGKGYFRCDFRRILQALVGLPIAFTAGLKAVTECEYSEDIVSTEYFKDENNAFKAGSTSTILAGTYIAHNITEFDGWLFYKNPVVAGSLIHVRVYANVTGATPDVYLHILGYKATGQSLLASLVEQVVTTNHILYVYEIPSTEVVRLVINLFQNYLVSSAAIIDPIELLVLPNCDRTRWLYFRNRMGGFSTVAFHDYTSSRRATKTGDYPGKAEVIETLYGYPITHTGATTTGNVYGDLITSPEVYKEDGTQVFVEMDEGLQAAEGEEVEIVIRYEVYQAI